MDLRKTIQKNLNNGVNKMEQHIKDFRARKAYLIKRLQLMAVDEVEMDFEDCETEINILYNISRKNFVVVGDSYTVSDIVPTPL